MRHQGLNSDRSHLKSAIKKSNKSLVSISRLELSNKPSNKSILKASNVSKSSKLLNKTQQGIKIQRMPSIKSFVEIQKDKSQTKPSSLSVKKKVISRKNLDQTSEQNKLSKPKSFVTVGANIVSNNNINNQSKLLYQQLNDIVKKSAYKPEV